MRRRLARIGLAAAVALGCSVPARAQEPIDRLIGRPIAAVELRIEGQLDTTPALLALIDIRPGERLAPEVWRRVAERFDRVPRFEGLSVRVDERPGGLVLIFDLVPTHLVDALQFVGATGLSIADLERRVRDEFNGVPQRARLTEVEDAVRRILRDEGYLSPAVAARVVPYHRPEHATLEVSVEAGMRAVVAAAEIRGQSPLDTDRTLERLGLTPGAPFRERALAAALAEVREDLRARQFYTAIAQYQPPVVSPDGARVSVVVTIDAGPLVDLQIAGELPGRVDDYIPIRRQNSVDADLLDDARVAIVQALRRQGYWRAAASYTTARPSPDRLVISFTIDRGQRYRIREVDLPADMPVDRTVVDAQKALKPGTWFDQIGVEAALRVITGLYQAEGYHRVTITPAYEEVAADRALEGAVIVRPRIEAGPKAVVTAITFALDAQPVVTEAELRRVMQSQERQPYSLAAFVADRQALPAYYESRGFFAQRVAMTPVISPDGTEVTLAVVAHEGPQILVGEIIVVGNEKVSTRAILDEIALKTGDPYSEAARAASQRALYNLSSFRSVRIVTEERLPGETAVRVVIAVEEADTKAYEYGVGVEGGTHPRSVEGGGVVDRTEFAPRGFVGFTWRNLGGRNRSLNAFARISLKPRNAPGDPARDGQGLGAPDYRVSAAYVEHYAFGLASDFRASATAEQALRTSYNFIRRVGSVEFLRPVRPHLSTVGRYTLEWTRLFDEVIPAAEQPLIDRLFPQVRISMFSGGVVWDRRNDPLSTTRGGQVSGNVDLALERLGSEVGFVKAFVQASFFHPVIGERRLVWASRVQFGAARGFEREVPVETATGLPVYAASGVPLTTTVADLPASQRFFAGGGTSVRAFQLDRLGVPEILTADGLSNGGNGLVVFNAELRALVARPFRRDLVAVAFADAGNVFNRAGDINLARLRTGVGFGVRYDSPLGPLRLDFGFKTDRLSIFTAGRERRWEFHLSIGEAF